MAPAMDEDALLAEMLVLAERLTTTIGMPRTRQSSRPSQTEAATREA